MAFSARAVANYFLARAERDGRAIDPMQLQKLVYYAHGWHLAITGQPLIKEAVEAWPYGPVIPSLFHDFKQWGSGPIRTPAAGPRVRLSSIFVSPHVTLDQEATDDAALQTAKNIIDRVWEVYGHYSGVRLSELTHRPGSPWFQARAMHPGQRGVPILNETLRQFFSDRIEHERNVAGAAG